MGRNWTPEEDAMLCQLYSKYGRQWSVIASQIPTRNATQVAARWEKCLNPRLSKGPFNEEEDAIILKFVEENGIHSWPKIASIIPNRTPKQCRERYLNNLDPSVTKTPWTPEEDELIFKSYLEFGPKWAVIAHHIPGRTDNSIKNRWNASISKRLRINENGEKTLAPCKVRKYSKKNKMIEQERPESLDLFSLSKPAPKQDFTNVSSFGGNSSGASSEPSANNSPKRSPLFSPFTLSTPLFGASPFGQDTPFSPFTSFAFPTTPDFVSPRLGFKMQSPLFTPNTGSHAFDEF